MKSQKIYSVSAVVLLTLLVCSFAYAGEIKGPFIQPEVGHSLSRPMREYSPAIRYEELVPRFEGSVSPSGTFTTILNFAGQPENNGALYSEATGAAGATQYVQLVNNEYTIYSKTTGAVVSGPITENALFSTFGGSCATTSITSIGDGTVTYDQLANVWVLSFHAVPTGGPYLNCVAVSTSSDATGTYNLYAFALTQMYPDKPRVGVWPDAYYVSQDVLNPSTLVFVRSQACALERSQMLTGGFAFSICFQGSISLPTFVVTTLDGQTLPPTGEQAFFWQLDQRPNNGKNNLNSFLFHVDWVTQSNSTFTGPVANALPAYTDACANFKPCVIEPGTTNLLQGWGDRLIGRVTYRNFGTYESVVMTHTINRGSGTTIHSAVRWYEYRTPLTPTLYQQGSFSPDGNFRWIPAIAQDKYGDIAVGYNISGSTVYPGLRYTGRKPTDHIGTLEGAEVILENGAGAQTNNHYWSSYQGMALDPVDDCTFWFTGQWYSTTSTSNWSTQITAFRFPSCTN
jgi:hypothetical protein